MRIAILGSVALPVPPPFQGGTEWVAYYQAEGLCKRGHDVTLFAAKGSKQGAYKLVEVGGGDTVVGSSVRAVVGSNLSGGSSITNFSDTPPPTSSQCPASIRSADLASGSGGPAARQPQKYSHKGTPILGHPDLASPPESNNQLIESSRKLRLENVYLAEVSQKLIELKDSYDVILNNMRGEAVFLPIAKMLGKPFVNVMHLPIFPDLSSLFTTFHTPVITISNAQRKEFPDLNYLATVGNCVDTASYSFGMGEGGYLLMMGTIGRHKNQGGAVKIAKALGMRLILAGKIRDQDYYDELKADIDGNQIKLLGEIDFPQKLKLYQEAKAFIFPILWEEPFGLVMIEAMACGTPVVAFGNGAVPEVVVDGKSGYIVDNNKFEIRNSKFEIISLGEEGLVEGVKRINDLSNDDYRKLRQNCRRHVEDNFTIDKMVDGYEKAIKNLVTSF
jgi:glycosyltransferase involved in cell wall biosynthesis